jgi:hypothetical protein
MEAERYGFQDGEEDSESEKQIRRKTTGSRRCRITNKDVIGRNPSCVNFSINRDFWCRVNSQCYDVIVCIARQKKSFENCPDCQQGRLLWEYVSAKNIEIILKGAENGNQV